MPDEDLHNLLPEVFVRRQLRYRRLLRKTCRYCMQDFSVPFYVSKQTYCCAAHFYAAVRAAAEINRVLAKRNAFRVKHGDRSPIDVARSEVKRNYTRLEKLYRKHGVRLPW